MNIFGQTFKSETGIILDKISSDVIPTYFEIPVLLSQSINQDFGLEKVCFHIKHKRPTDLKIQLLSPDGTSVWLSNRNGNKNNYGYLNTCVVQYGFNGSIHDEQGRFFEGEYSAEGRLDFMNNNQDPNGIWLLIISDLKEGELGKLESAQITFGNHPASINQSDCSLENAKDCFSSDPKNRLLPDLIVSNSLTLDNIQYYDENDVNYPNQLRFAAAMANIGEGPLHIITSENWYCQNQIVDKKTKCMDGSFPSNHVQQLIYYKTEDQQIQYDTIKSGIMYFDDRPGHNHYHVENWASFKLLKKRWWTKNKKYWKEIAMSDKISYCLFDNKICDSNNQYCENNQIVYTQENLRNYGLGSFTSCNSKIQGISVGGIDYYGINYEGQSILLPANIKPGKYYLFIEVDPYREYLESDTSNNSITVEVNIK